MRYNSHKLKETDFSNKFRNTVFYFLKGFEKAMKIFSEEVFPIKLVDELYEMYRNKLTGDEEDIDMLAFAFLEEMSQEDLISLIQDMDKQELYDLMGLYLIESLKAKFAQEEYGQHRTHTYYPRNVH